MGMHDDLASSILSLTFASHKAYNAFALLQSQADPTLQVTVEKHVENCSINQHLVVH